MSSFKTQISFLDVVIPKKKKKSCLAAYSIGVGLAKYDQPVSDLYKPHPFYIRVGHRSSKSDLYNLLGLYPR